MRYKALERLRTGSFVPFAENPVAEDVETDGEN